ncbi:aldo-keto reductase [Aureobasidium pullulans]|uniref:Aldo-keto reductase n=2 Tax=Aureobasidium pullulans TaxID=5580 RepID=A0A074XKF4_AURPU|nr:aldo-keto reductase [Aureobasidium pullulans EXF-150]THV94088.1 aldo-keto reductase [Aureobasidium pullulans]KEQ84159.1 aldo-keto reductase [Aureobasidium pullulans EXF-150]THW29316.1 aldo-keto reductase [Aureobasidium pullulans]THW34576.1 aldo-keto reductase [Aureobasidium pullulans]THW45134.1 aldo-keto reductase [Aureobasidium pullulans]
MSPLQRLSALSNQLIGSSKVQNRAYTMSSQFTLQSTLALPNSSVKIPALGFGVYQSHGPTCKKSCLTALEAGYRHIDSAQYYANEQLVGDAVKESNVDRKDVFITTKILSPGKDEEETYQSLVESVNKIDEGGYVDLFLIHSPSSGPQGRKTMWTALERLHKEGKAKAIGVSNFGKGQIEELKTFAKVWPPHVNQIELHPWNQQRVAVEYCQANNIVVEAYCPLVRNQKADDPTLKSLSEKYKKSTGQVLIRYCLQKGWVPLPKSDTPSRIKDNADIYDFEISKEDMSKLDDLDQGAAGAIVQAVDN